MPYREYLQTPEWQATRKAALKRAWYRCQVCNDHKMPLYVHHRTYERRGHELPEDVFVLCASCHANYDPQFAAKRQKPAENTPPAASEPEARLPPLPDSER
jgi:5-methylcytosine-specific restriction endonuclease McrA